MINNVILVGTIANEIVVRRVGDFDVVTVVLRVQRNFRDMDTNEYKCDFIPVTFWNVYAQNIGEYCAKGDIVGVKGRLTRKQSVVNGQNIYTTDVIGERIIFIDLKTYNEQFKGLKDKSIDEDKDFGEPSLEELKRMAHSVDIVMDDSEDEFGEENSKEKSKKGKKKI